MSHEKRSFYFFSYGSNLLFERIKSRVPSVEIVKCYQLKEFRLVFDKISRDDSTKANLKKTGNSDHSVWGVIQKIDLSEKTALDITEGLGKGYELESFDSPTHTHEIYYYIAKDDKYLKEGNPYDWYLDYVIMGGIENDLPREYIKQLLNIAATVDHAPESRIGYDKGVTENIKMHKELNPKVWER